MYRLCCTGSINARKGQRLIIEALKNIPKDILKEIHIDFIGDGSDRIPLEMMVKDNELEKHVSFLGLIPNNEVYKYLANNNIFILMSKNEGLPISIIEAMRESMAIISTEVSGIPELVKTGYNGILLNPNTIRPHHQAHPRLLSKSRLYPSHRTEQGIGNKCFSVPSRLPALPDKPLSVR